MHKYLIPLVFSVLLPVLPASAAAPAPSPPGWCLRDLEDIAAFLPVNDAGARGHLASHGGAIEQALRKARVETANAVDTAACDAALEGYLRAWRPGHLRVASAPPPGAGVSGSTARPDERASGDPRAPKLAVLGKDTVLLTFPTFNDRYIPAVKALLAEHRAALESHKNWIIDVRNNGGGSDVTYQPLLPWLLDGEYLSYGFEYLATPANIKAQEGICALTVVQASCAQTLEPVLRKMRVAPTGSMVLSSDARVTSKHPGARAPNAPARVAVLVDRDCGSTCEQFLLTVRSSFRVKLVGRPSFGALDASNMRMHPLPSGRVLFYATTLSTRLPDMRVDTVGIPPDILLPKPADQAGYAAEVAQVQRWLETGSWQ